MIKRIKTEHQQFEALDSAYKRIYAKEVKFKKDFKKKGNGTSHHQTLGDMFESEERYRRLFETAQDGVLILDAESGAITDANPYITDSLGYSLQEILGKRLWEIGAFVDVKESKAAFEELQKKEYIRYKDLPLKTKDGQNREVEFISNVYLVNGKKVIQCNIRDITERRNAEKVSVKAEEGMRQSEERYRRLFESAKDGILILDGETGAIDDANPYILKKLGYTLDDLHGKRLWEIGAFADVKDSKAAFEELQRKTYIRYEDLPLKTSDGQTREVEFISNVYLVNGKKVIQCNIRDITERKEIENVLRESEEKFRIITENSADAIFIADAQGKYIYVNNKAANMLGYSVEELLSFTIVDISPKNRLEEYFQILHDILREGKLFTEIELVTKDGTIVPTDFNAVVLPNGNIYASCRDITDRKRTEKLIRESEKRFKALFDQAPMAIALVGVDGRPTISNDQFTNMLGYSKDEMRQLKFTDFTYHEDVESDLKSFNDLIEGKISQYSMEKRYINKNGKLIWGDLFATILRDEHGAPNEIIRMAKDISERKLSEIALQESNEKFRQLAENITDVFWIRSPDLSEVQYISPAFEKIWGRSMESLYANPHEWSSFIHPEDRERVLASFATLSENISSIDIEYRIIRSDMEIRWVHTRGFQVRNIADKLIRHIGIVSDITDRKIAEEELKKSEQKYRGIFENVQDVFFDTTIDGIINELSPSISLVTKGQYHRDELVGKSIYSFVSDVEKAKELLSVLQQRGSVVDYEITMCNRDNSLISFSVSAKIQFDPQGEPEKIVGSMRDIGERKEAEKRIALLAHTLKSVSECVSITDLNETIIFVNTAFLTMYGYSEDEVLGKNISIVRSPNNPPNSTDGIFYATLNGVWNGELLNRTKSGHEFMISLSTSYVQNEQGETIALVGIASDVTEKKIIQQQLLQAQKSESIGTLAGGIAHDFNNILAIILGYTYIIEKRGSDTETMVNSIAAINQAANRGSALVKQILTFARKTEILFEPSNIVDLIQELISMLKQTFPKVIVFQENYSSNIPYVFADRSQIHQALLNLCVNARDAMPNGGSIIITVEQLSGLLVKEQFPNADRMGYICISVSDTGEGMNETTRNKIFDPFFTTKPQGKGTGLGLAVVYGIVQAHHGFITAESVLEKGTTFHLYLPIPENTMKSIESLEAISFDDGGTETILLVEDEALLLEMVSYLLQSKGYTVLVAHDGSEGVEVYTKHQKEIALVVTDLGLPIMTGLEEYKKLKEINPNVEVIFASGFIDPDVRSELLTVGANHFLQKPYVADDILRTIRKVLDQK